jgi:hypothetical protein
MIQSRYFLLFILVFFFGMSSLSAQDYNKAIGLRLGYPASVSYKVFLDGSNNAVEGFLSFRSYGNRRRNGDFRYRSFGLGVGYQVHKPIEEVNGLQWYYGIGGRLSFFNDNDGFIDEGDRTGIALLGFLGLDYKFADAPINISLDWVPDFRIIGYNNGFGGDNGALAVRYTF